MVLFIRDWLIYPSASPDYTTKNKSFIRYAGLLKSMGIENNSFCLALHDQSLVGIDPHSKELTNEQILAIMVECKINPWYFIREVARAPALSGSTPSMFRGNRFTISLFWLFFNHITSLGIAPRQTGKSFSTDMLMTLLIRISLENTNVNLLTKDDDLRVKNVTRLKDIAEELPSYMNLKMKGDTNNTEKITINRLGNTYTTAVAQSSPKAALNTGRGSTFAINHIDEIAFIKNIDITLPALLAASGKRVA